VPSFGLIGPSYETLNRGVDSQRLINMLPALVESGAGAGGKFAYYNTPGFELFSTLPKSPVRCLWAGNERLFAIGGDHVYEVAADGTTITDIGAIGSATTPGQIVSNGSQLLVWDGILTPTSANTWLLTGAQPPIPVISSVGITYMDGYFVALRPGGADYACDPASVVVANQTQFNLSALLDGGSWDPLDYAVETSAPDAVLMVLGPGSFNGGPEELWLMGRKTIRIWYNTGGTALNPFPFERVHGAFINTGVWAKHSIVGFKNTVVFVSASDRGVAGPVVKMNGYIPERISNHAVEASINAYIAAGSDYSNAVAYGYEENGHTFYVLTFPTANKQWVCDLTTNQWHERAAGSTWAALTAPPAMFHADVWGKHLVADLNSGKILRARLDLYQQEGSAILRGRVAPHLNNETLRVMYRSLWLKVGGPFNVTRTYTLENSDDGGFNYGTPKSLSIGAGQQSTSRIEWRRLGMSRDRVFRITTTDNQPQAWVDGYVKFEKGTGG